MGRLGFSLWLPSMLKKAFHTAMQVVFVAILPQIAAGVAIILVGRSADRRGSHVAHMSVVLGSAAVIFAGASLISTQQKWLVVGSLVLGTAGWVARYGPLFPNGTKIMP